MSCKAASSLQGSVLAPTLPLSLPQNQAQWTQFIVGLQSAFRQLAAANMQVPQNLIPSTYATFNGSSLPSFTATGCTVSQDSSTTLGGLQTLKVTVTAANATLTFGAGKPFQFTPNATWLFSCFAKASGVSSGVVTITTGAGTYTTNFDASLSWEQLYDTLNLVADPNATFGVTLSFPSAVGTTFNFSGFAMQQIPNGANANVPVGTISGILGVDLGNALLSGNLPYDNNSAQVTHVVGNNDGAGQLNASPAGGVTGNLPLGNHATSVQIGSVTGNQVNLVPDSGLKSTGIYWPSKSGSIEITKNIDNVNNCIEYVGTGSPSAYNYLATIPFTVTPGTYTLSANGWTNNVTAGHPQVLVYNTAFTGGYGALTLTENGRQQTQITIPPGVTQVVVAFDTDNCTVASGQGCGAQQIQFEQGSVMTAYKENVGDQNAGSLGIDFDNTIHANKNLANIADDPLGNWRRVGGVNGSNLLGFKSLIGDTSGDNSAALVDAGNLRFLHGVMSTPLQDSFGASAGSDGSYLNNGMIYNRHLSEANLDGLANSATRLAWLNVQQESLIQTPSRNYVLDPYFRNIGAFWSGGSAIPTESGSSVTFGTAAASTYYNAYNQEGHGSLSTIPVYLTDTIILELTCTQAGTGTTDTYLGLDFRNAADTNVGYGGVHANVPGTFTNAAPVPAGAIYADIFLQTYGGASGGNGAYIANPKIRINHETTSDINGNKAYINGADNSAGGHINMSSYALSATMPQAISSGENLVDGGTGSFNGISFVSTPEIIFGDGGVTYDPTLPTGVVQYQDFTYTCTPTGGPYTGFTASLKISVAGSAATQQSVNFSGTSATLTVPASQTIVSGLLTVSGSLSNATTESQVWTVSIKDGSTVLGTLEMGVSAKTSTPFNKTVTDSAAVNGTVISLSTTGGAVSGNSCNYSTQTAAASHTATPAGVPGVSWKAFATS